MSSELFTVCFWSGMKAMQFISCMSETQGGGLIRDQFPTEHDSSSAWEPAPLRWKHSYRVVHLLVNYIGLMFNLYF